MPDNQAASFGGGSIISPIYILTAAHNVDTYDHDHDGDKHTPEIPIPTFRIVPPTTLVDNDIRSKYTNK